jgi:hypothetical protein
MAESINSPIDTKNAVLFTKTLWPENPNLEFEEVGFWIGHGRRAANIRATPGLTDL